MLKSGTLKYPLHMDRLLHWLVNRQTSVLQEDEEYEVSDGETAGTATSEMPDPSNVEAIVVPPSEISRAGTPSLDVVLEELLWAGFNGRCNKTADTCYSFWNGGTLAVRCCSISRIEPCRTRRGWNVHTKAPYFLGS